MNSRSRKKLINALVILLVVIMGSYVVPRIEVMGSDKSPVPSGFYRVSAFNDGDTLTVDMAGRSEKVRMIGVDTPETEDPRKPVQCYGKAASEFTRTLIGGQAVRLEADPENTNRDRYGRLLRYIYLQDGRLINGEIIRAGYGFAYTSFPFTKKEAFKALQVEAQEARRGLWSSCEPEKNEYGGYTSNPEEN